MAKIFIEDFSSGIADSTMFPSKASSTIQFNRLAPKGSLSKWGLCNPFISKGGLGLATPVSIVATTDTLKDDTSTLLYIGRSFTGNCPTLYTTPVSASTPRSFQITKAALDETEIGYSFSTNPSAFLASGHRARASVVATISAVTDMYILTFVGSGDGWGLWRQNDSNGGNSSVDVKSTMTGASVVLDLGSVGAVRTPMFTTKSNFIYILTPKYVHQIDGLLNTFTPEVLKAPAGKKFIAAMEYAGQILLVCESDTEGEVSVYSWTQKVTSGIVLDMALQLDRAKTVYDFFILDGKPTIIAKTKDNMVSMYQYANAVFTLVKELGHINGGNSFDVTSTGVSTWKTGSLEPCTSQGSRMGYYKNGVVYVTLRGDVYWIGKILPSAQSYSFFQLASIKTKLTGLNLTLQPVCMLCTYNDTIIVVADYGIDGLSVTNLFVIDTLATINTSSTQSRVTINDTALPSASVVNFIKLVIGGSREGQLSDQSIKITATVTFNGTVVKTYEDSISNIMDRGFMYLPANHPDTSRVRVDLQTNIIGETNLHKLPILERIEIDYTPSTKTK